MRQAILLKPGKLEIRQVPDLLSENLKPEEVLIRIMRIGVCGSDIHVYHGQHPATPYPVVQGHEYSAIVEAVGSHVKNIKTGMKVTARPQLVCGACGPCLRGQYNACQNLKVQGFQAPGVAQDLFVVTEDRVVILDNSMSFEQGAMVEPAAVGAHSTRRASNLKGKNVIVSGAGTIGNLVAQFAKTRGAKTVIITDVSEFRLEKARECNIENTINVSKESFEDGVGRILGSEGFQTGFEAAGVQDSLDVLIKNIEKGGEVIILGVYALNPTINMFYLGEHELNVIGSMMYKHEDYEEAANLIATRKILSQSLISRHFKFEEYNDAYKYINNKGDRIMKVMIDVND
ncbi:MAG: alcohol dehydrogenase catalytic domain-containing protein [Bacteroidales bacterium]|nr:alcohol dehydrogenase catalytic domain-containing protein [Bacteroidales bacterium]